MHSALATRAAIITESDNSSINSRHFTVFADLPTVKYLYLAVTLFWRYWRLRQKAIKSSPPILYAEFKRRSDKKENLMSI